MLTVVPVGIVQQLAPPTGTVFFACSDPFWHQPAADAKLNGHGLERTEPLKRDIEYMEKRWGLTAPSPAEDGPGHSYAR